MTNYIILLPYDIRHHTTQSRSSLLSRPLTPWINTQRLRAQRPGQAAPAAPALSRLRRSYFSVQSSPPPRRLAVA